MGDHKAAVPGTVRLERACGGEADRWTPESTHVPIDGTPNLRDLGGTPTRTGEIVVGGRLYRAEVLVWPGRRTECSVWDAANADAYAALGVRTVIDLRSGFEQSRRASAWPDATGAEHIVTIPIEEGVEGDTHFIREIMEGRLATFTATDLGEYYSLTLRRRSREFGAVLRMIGEGDRLPVLVHCTAGKDRTGLLIALLLEALGVARDIVVAEYALTGRLRPNRVADYAYLFDGREVDLAGIAPLFDSPAEAMAAALAELDAEYGSTEGYLSTECGLGTAELAALRANLLIPT